MRVAETQKILIRPYFNISMIQDPIIAGIEKYKRYRNVLPIKKLIRIKNDVKY